MRWLSGLVLSACLALSVAAGAQQPITLKLSHFLGPDSYLQRDFAEPWARELEARSGGRLKLEIYDATSPFGDVSKQAAQVQQGTIDIALGLRGAEAGRFPRSGVVELPFAVQDALDGSRALWDLYTAGPLAGEYQDFKVLALFTGSPALIHTTIKRIALPEDLKDQHLQAPDRAVAGILQSIGVTAVLLPPDNMLPALKSGAADGIVSGWGSTLPEFTAVLQHHLQVPIYTPVYFLLMNRQKYASLPADLRATVDALSGAPLVARFGLLWNKWDRPLRSAAIGAGQDIVIPDEATMEKWRAAVQPATQQALAVLTAAGFADADAAYQRLAATAP